jgi:hypothetical protein
MIDAVFLRRMCLCTSFDGGSSRWVGEWKMYEYVYELY